MKALRSFRASARRLGLATLAMTIVPVFCGASYRTPNFVVEAPTAETAKAVGDHAEHCRKQIALQWLGKELPNWKSPCPVKATFKPCAKAW